MRIQPMALAKLKELVAKLPPAPWSWCCATTKPDGSGTIVYAAQIWKADGTDLGFYSSDGTDYREADHAVEALAALRNLAPHMIEELEAGQRLRDAMIKRFVQREVSHSHTGARWGNRYSCELCGIRASTPELIAHGPECPLL